MIKRVSDEIFDNKTFTRIAETLKQNTKKLFSVVNSESEASRIKHDLQVNGYQAVYEKKGEFFNIYYSPEAPKFKMDENILKDFKSIGDNRYQAFNKTSVAGVYDFAFDEGSIWTLKTMDDGEQYLVKEINGEDENDVIRQKKASMNKSGNNIINNSLDEAIVNILKKNKYIVTESLVKELHSNCLASLAKDTTKLEDIINKTINQNEKKQGGNADA